MITLAVMTGISAEQWGKEGGRAIATAMDVIAERNRPSRGGDGDGEADPDAADPG